MNNFEAELTRDFLLDSIADLNKFQDILENIVEGEVLSIEQSKNIFRIVHTLKGNSQATGFIDMAHVFHYLEDILSKTKSGTYSTDKKLIDLFYKVIIKVQGALELYQINHAAEIDFSELVAQIENYDNKKVIDVKKYKIAIIDDDQNTREILKEILQLEIKADFIEYEDAHLILKELEKTKFDLILTDYKMPIIDGNTFIKTLRLTKNINSHTPVMFITGESPDFLPAKDVVKDVYFIQKPFAFSRILYYAKLSLLNS